MVDALLATIEQLKEDARAELHKRYDPVMSRRIHEARQEAVDVGDLQPPLSPRRYRAPVPAASSPQAEDEEEPMEYSGGPDHQIPVLSESDHSTWSDGSSTVDLNAACYRGESDASSCESDDDYLPPNAELHSAASSSAPRRSKRLHDEAAAGSE